MQSVIRISVDRHINRLARPHIGQLRLLEVGRDPDLIGDKHRDCLSGLDILSFRAGEADDAAGLGRNDRCVFEVLLRFLLACAWAWLRLATELAFWLSATALFFSAEVTFACACAGLAWLCCKVETACCTACTLPDPLFTNCCWRLASCCAYCKAADAEFC